MNLDRLLKVSAIAASWFIVYSAGVTVNLLEVWPSGYYRQAIDAYTAYRAKSQMMDEDKKKFGHLRNREEVIEQATVESPLPQKQFPGVTFICKEDYTSYLIDAAGKKIHEWKVPPSKVGLKPVEVRQRLPDASVRCVSGHVFPNGDMMAVYHGLGDTPYGYGIAKVDKDSNPIWSHNVTAHHDLHLAEDGSIYTLTHRFVTRPMPDVNFVKYPILADWILILSPDGKEEKSINLMRSFLGSSLEQFIKRNQDGFDVTHANSVMPLPQRLADKFPMFKPGDILVSLKTLNALVVIDPRTERVVWVARGVWRDQHQARFLDNGNILLFDNEGKGIFSRVLEINPATRRVVWDYDRSEDMFCPLKSGAERLPNGNTIVIETTNQDTQKANIYEVTRQKEIVWHYSLDLPIWDAHRYGFTYFDEAFCAAIGCPASHAKGKSQ